MEPAPTTHMTCQSNKLAHPGLPNVDKATLLKPIPKPYRTKAQIAADNKEKVQKKKDKAAADKEQELKKALGVKIVAAMQNQMHEEDIQSNLHAAHPPAKKTAKVTKPVVDNSAESTIHAEDPDLEHTIFGFSGNDMGSEDESELTGTMHCFQRTSEMD
ncbi:hypothetical protein L208DRAFT_1382587 [Tricholoma matsutake]|nr:hypothetical protein L208DRAFT_1382587 [Tricholoma matsutake 945]